VQRATHSTVGPDDAAAFRTSRGAGANVDRYGMLSLPLGEVAETANTSLPMTIPAAADDAGGAQNDEHRGKEGHLRATGEAVVR